jgi:hypothetical protein
LFEPFLLIRAWEEEHMHQALGVFEKVGSDLELI